MRSAATENGFHEPREMTLVLRCDRRQGQLTGRRNAVTESNAMTQAQTTTLDEGRPLSRPMLRASPLIDIPSVLASFQGAC